jgi:tetratricopeptide (TPR) repeat protein
MIGWYYEVIRQNDTALECDEALGHVNQAMDLVETPIEKQMIESLRKKISADLKGAIQTLERAIAGPNSDWNSAKHFQKADACALLATFQRELGDTKSALSTLESALQSNPNDLLLINELVMEYADQGVRLEEALSLIERALKDQPENPIFIATKGWVLFKLRRREEAKVALERSVELLPECEEAREHLRHITDDR